MIGSGGTKRVSSRVAKNRISATVQMVQRTGTLTERAHRIAEQYLDDPAHWAAADINGRGITLCTRSVDPSFLDGAPMRINMVQKQIKELERDLAANGLSPPEIQSRRDRAATEVQKRRQAEAAHAAGTSPSRSGTVYDNERDRYPRRDFWRPQHEHATRVPLATPRRYVLIIEGVPRGDMPQYLP